jgi:type VI secretion system ImpM family protein
MTLPLIGSFGKLPWHGDFLRDVPASAPIDLIDAWLAQAPIGPPGTGSASFDAAGPAMALVRARGCWWALCLFPSRDSVGRRFPFCVLAGLPEEEFAGEVGLLPSAWTPFLVRCLQQGARGWPSSQAALHEAVAACNQPVDVEGEERRLVDHLADHSVDSWLRTTLGASADPRRAGVWADLTELARDPQRATGLIMRPMAHQIHLSFVLMLQRLVGDEGCMPVFIGLHPGSPGDQASATILWGRPTAGECLAALWPTMPGGSAARIHDLVQRPGTIGDASDAPTSLDRPGSSLRDMLHDAGSATRRFRRTR